MALSKPRKDSVEKFKPSASTKSASKSAPTNKGGSTQMWDRKADGAKARENDYQTPIKSTLNNITTGRMGFTPAPAQAKKLNDAIQQDKKGTKKAPMSASKAMERTVKSAPKAAGVIAGTVAGTAKKIIGEVAGGVRQGYESTQPKKSSPAAPPKPTLKPGGTKLPAKPGDKGTKQTLPVRPGDKGAKKTLPVKPAPKATARPLPAKPGSKTAKKPQR